MSFGMNLNCAPSIEFRRISPHYPSEPTMVAYGVKKEKSAGLIQTWIAHINHWVKVTMPCCPIWRNTHACLTVIKDNRTAGRILL